MDPTLKLLYAMASECSGISEYWRGRIQKIINGIPQEPRNMVEIAEDEEPPVANEVIAAD